MEYKTNSRQPSRYKYGKRCAERRSEEVQEGDANSKRALVMRNMFGHYEKPSHLSGMWTQSLQ